MSRRSLGSSLLSVCPVCHGFSLHFGRPPSSARLLVLVLPVLGFAWLWVATVLTQVPVLDHLTALAHSTIHVLQFRRDSRLGQGSGLGSIYCDGWGEVP